MFERLLGPTRLGGRAAPSGVILNGPTGRTANLCSERTFGDVELYLEFMLAKGSNSGVYLQGLSEIQIFDSWGSSEGVRRPTPAQSITAGSTSRASADRRRSSTRRVVRANGSRTRSWFRAPRFDAAGKKTQPARFVRVLFNGQLVQKDVDIDGPTRASLESGSRPGSPDDPGRPRTRGFPQRARRPLRPLILR